MPADYVIVGFEKTKAGIPHIQAYLETQKNWPYVRKCLGRYSIIVAKGTKAQNIAYCAKGGQFLINPI